MARFGLVRAILLAALVVLALTPPAQALLTISVDGTALNIHCEPLCPDSLTYVDLQLEQEFLDSFTFMRSYSGNGVTDWSVGVWCGYTYRVRAIESGIDCYLSELSDPVSIPFDSLVAGPIWVRTTALPGAVQVEWMLADTLASPGFEIKVFQVDGPVLWQRLVLSCVNHRIDF